MKIVYLVIQPVGSSAELRLCGPIISRHRTPRAAALAISRENRALHSQPGMEQSWVERVIVAVDAGETRHLNAEESEEVWRAP